MATDATKIEVGSGVFSIGDWVTAGGAGSLADVGHIKSPFEIGVAMENFDVETERAIGIVKTTPTKDDYTLKVHFHEADPEWLGFALGQPDANLTGTAPDETLLVGDRSERYHQATIVGTGIGTTAVRTWTFWRLQVISLEPVLIGKAVEQSYNVTFRILRDDSVSTADKHFNQADT